VGYECVLLVSGSERSKECNAFISGHAYHVKMNGLLSFNPLKMKRICFI
jgi:hypothetical protein